MLLLNERLKYLFLIVIILLFSVACKTFQAGLRPKKESVKVENLFFTYDFTLEKKSVKQRVRFLDSLGYQGITFPVNTLKDIEKLKEYQQFVKSETNSRIKIPAIFFSLNPETKKADETWKKISDQLKGTETDIWVIVKSTKK